MEEKEDSPQEPQDIHKLLPYKFYLNLDHYKYKKGLNLRVLTNIPVDDEGGLKEEINLKKPHVVHFPGRSDAAHCYWQYAIAANGRDVKNPDNFFTVVELPSQGGSDFLVTDGKREENDFTGQTRPGHIDSLQTYIDAIDIAIEWANFIAQKSKHNFKSKDKRLKISCHSMSSQFVLLWLAKADDKKIQNIDSFHFFAPMIGFKTGIFPLWIVRSISSSIHYGKYFIDFINLIPFINADISNPRESKAPAGHEKLTEKAAEVVKSREGQALYVKLWQRHADLIVGEPTWGWIYNCLIGRGLLLKIDPKKLLRGAGLIFYIVKDDKVVDNEDTKTLTEKISKLDKKNSVQLVELDSEIYGHHPFFEKEFYKYLRSKVFDSH